MNGPTKDAGVERIAITYRGHVYRLYPTAAQAARLSSWVGAVRYVYNLALEQRQTFWRPGRRFDSTSQGRDISPLRQEAEWLADAPADCLHQALRDLDQAYRSWWAGFAARPTFRRVGINDSLRFHRADKFRVSRTSRRGGQLRAPKIGNLKIRWDRAPKGTVKSATVFRRAGLWFVSILSEVEASTVSAVNGGAVGIDRGISAFAALSTGELIAPVNALARCQSRLRRAQKRLARKQRGSNNRRKQRLRVARLHMRVANARKDFLHKVSTGIAKSHSVVVIENLRVRNMVRSAAGTIEAPGRNVRQKAGLNRSILDQGWGMFRSMLAYKLSERGGHLIEVPANDTSRTCAECGVVDAESRHRQRFICTACGHEANADTNAAINILRRGAPFMPVEGQPSSGPVEAGTHRRSA